MRRSLEAAVCGLLRLAMRFVVAMRAIVAGVSGRSFPKAAAAVSEYRVVVSVEVTPTEWAPAYAWR